MVRDIEIADTIPDNEVIWRYMDFASFYALLQTKSLFFRRLDKYTDEYEGELPEEVKAGLVENWTPLFGVVESTRMVSDFCSRLKQFNSGTLSNSWVATSEEIYAMWKIYLRGGQEGVAIRTTVGKIRESLSVNQQDFTLAKVSYDILSWFVTDYTTLAAYKSKPYSYENELRILVYNQFEDESVPIDVFPKVPLYEHGANFIVDIDKLIDEVYISPFTGQWFYDIVKSATQIFMPTFNINKIITSRIKDK